MLKKLLFAFIVLFSLQSFAQRLNERGLKCVSEFEISGREYDGYRYVFEYFDDLKLKAMYVYSENTLKHKFTMNNGVLTRKSYDYIDSDSEWVYDMDVYGNVTRATRTCIAPDGSGFKTEHTYTYAQSERNPWRNVVEDNEIEFARLSRTKPFRRNNNNNTRKFEYRDGIIWDVSHREQFPNHYTDKDFNSVARQFNFSVKNDTNIDFWQLWFSRTSNETIIALTEWLSLRPDYLMGSKDDYFEYIYEYDTKGNLIKITNKDPNRIIKEVKIKYLY